MIGTRQTDAVAFARHVFEAFRDGDMEAFFDALDPDVRAHPSIDGGPLLEGRDAVARWLQDLGAATGDIEARPLDYELRGNCVIVRGYLRHRVNRTLSESQVFWLYEIRDGRIARMESHPTRKAALEAC